MRHYITCDTCNHPHTLRIQVGHEDYQEHEFQCFECEEDIVIGMEVDQVAVSLSINEVRNCQRGCKEGTIVNLSPDFPIAKEDRHRDKVFPSLHHVQNFAKAQESLGIELPSFSSPEELEEWARNFKGLSEIWPTVKKGWSLTVKGRLDLAKEHFEDYREGFDEPYELRYVLFDFCCRMLQPAKYSLFEEAATKCQHIGNVQRTRLEAFRDYFKDEMANEHLERYFVTFSEYFSCFSDFSQTLAHIQYGIPISDEFEASSYAFSKTKQFYGNAYETLTSNVSVLACLNNVANGRDFDKFESMNLKKYLTINKANRCNPFKDVPEFHQIGACLDSTIRNASHHGGMKLTNKGRTILYKSGGTGMQKSMSYLNYINQCNEVMLSCCALLAIELVISFEP